MPALPNQRLLAPIDRVCVVVPARDEAETLSACLHAISDAARQAASIDVGIVMVLDSCTDDSQHIAAEVTATRGQRIRILTTRAGSAAAARRVGIEEAIRRSAPPLHRVWVASTDADSVVPGDWLQRHLAHAQSGAVVVAGTVQVDDWSRWPDQVRDDYEKRYAHHLERTGHGHVHGANLGIRADLYQRLGGFDAAAVNEDVDLIRRARHCGVEVTWALDMAVRTSSRAVGRAPFGFADHLRQLGTAAARSLR
jgi:glycosyltransferase involved in cell wall biosynthesis